MARREASHTLALQAEARRSKAEVVQETFGGNYYFFSSTVVLYQHIIVIALDGSQTRLQTQDTVCAGAFQVLRPLAVVFALDPRPW